MGQYWKNKSLFWNTYKLVFSSHPWLTLLEGLTYLGSALITGLMPLAWKILFDGIYRMIQESNPKAVILPLVVFAGFQACETLIRLAGRMPNRVFGYWKKVTFSLRAKLYQKAAQLNLIDFEKSQVYDTYVRAEQAVNAETPMMLLTYLYQTPALLLSLITMTITVWTFSPYFVLAAVVSILPATLIYYKKGERAYQKQKNQTGNVRARDYFWSLFLNPGAVKEMRVYHSFAYFKDKWLQQQKTIQEGNWAFWKKNFLSGLLMEGFRVLGYSCGTILSAVFLAMGLFPISAFGAVIQSFGDLQGTYDRFLSNLNSMQESYLFFNDYIRFMNLDTESYGETTPTSPMQTISLRQVSFRYPNQEKNALSDISLTINAGEKIAIVGENGCGKSTLCKIIGNLYAPEGEILWNGVPYSQCSKDVFRGISAAFQDFMKYHMTVRENVAVGCIQKLDQDQQLRDLLRDNDLDVLPLDQQLGREFGGEELSGGQWQRLALSRGELPDGEVLIFDEPTAALDPVAEADIFKKLLKKLNQKTLLLVTHRIGSAQLADRILVMDQGRIVETGTHMELLTRKGKYSEMYEMQAKWYRNDV